MCPLGADDLTCQYTRLMDLGNAEIRIKAKACAAIVDNIQAFLQVDYSDDLEYEEAVTRIEALGLMFKDILDQVYGHIEDTENEIKAKRENQYYVPISLSQK